MLKMHITYPHGNMKYITLYICSADVLFHFISFRLREQTGNLLGCRRCVVSNNEIFRSSFVSGLTWEILKKWGGGGDRHDKFCKASDDFGV